MEWLAGMMGGGGDQLPGGGDQLPAGVDDGAGADTRLATNTRKHGKPTGRCPI